MFILAFHQIIHLSWKILSENACSFPQPKDLLQKICFRCFLKRMSQLKMIFNFRSNLKLTFSRQSKSQEISIVGEMICQKQTTKITQCKIIQIILFKITYLRVMGKNTGIWVRISWGTLWKQKSNRDMDWTRNWAWRKSIHKTMRYTNQWGRKCTLKATSIQDLRHQSIHTKKHFCLE